MSDNVTELREFSERLSRGFSEKLTPGELNEIEEVRFVPMTRTQADVIGALGKGLTNIGVHTNGAMLVGLAAQWKVSRKAP
jgi:hypothetical protein